MLLPREVPLFAFQPSAVVGESKRTDCHAVGVLSVREYPYVNAGALIGILKRFRRLILFRRQGERTCSLAGFFLTVTCMVGDRSVEPNWNGT